MAGSAHEANVWRFVQLVFEDSARAKLLLKLGFDPQAIAAEVARLGGPLPFKPQPPCDAPTAAPPFKPASQAENDASAEDFFGGESSHGATADDNAAAAPAEAAGAGAAAACSGGGPGTHSKPRSNQG